MAACVDGVQMECLEVLEEEAGGGGEQVEVGVFPVFSDGFSLCSHDVFLNLNTHTPHSHTATTRMADASASSIPQALSLQLSPLE